jgi:hypothetical protein
MTEPPKKRWADIADEEDLKSLEVPVVISKHGIKIKKMPVPPVPSDKNASRRIGKNGT